MHTQGEWNRACDSYGKVQHSRKYDCVYTTVKGTNGERIVTVAARIGNGHDADLIAAAPDLLTSLTEMVADLISHASLGLNEHEVVMLKRAEAAVKKAKGEA